MADISGNIILEVAKSGDILFYNSKAKCVFCGLNEKSNLNNIINFEEKLVLIKNIDTAFYQQYPHHFYWEYQTRFYLVYVYPKDKSVWLSIEDISEKRQLAHLLYTNRQRMMFAEMIAKLGYWELDVAAKRFYWSEEVYKIFEMNGDEKAYHKNLIRELVHPDDLPLYKQKL